MSERFAIVQPRFEPPGTEKLARALRGVPGLTPSDALTVCNEAGILCRGMTADQAAALLANLKAEAVAVEIVNEAQLPTLPPPKIIRRIGIQTEALLVDDIIRGMIPVAWEQVRLIAAGSVQLTKITRHERVIEELRHDPFQALIPVPSLELRVEYDSKERGDWFLRAEIVLADRTLRYSIEAERFLFISLGEEATKNLAANFCLLVRGLVAHAPDALLNRGVASIMSDACEFAYYPRKAAFYDEITWMLWKAQSHAE
jgi:hypothetical protein